MDPFEFATEDVLLLYSGGVVETFHSAYDRSFRTPAAWLGVKVEAGKHDRVGVTVGRADQRDQPFYGSDTQMSWTDVKFDLDAAEEVRMRAFFSAVAQASGRLGPG